MQVLPAIMSLGAMLGVCSSPGMQLWKLSIAVPALCIVTLFNVVLGESGMAEHIVSCLYNISRNPAGVKLLHKYRDVFGPIDEMYVQSICCAVGLPKLECKLWIQVVFAYRCM